MKKSLIVLSFGGILLFSCQPHESRRDKKNRSEEKNQTPEKQQPKKYTYALKNTKEWLLENGKDSAKLAIVVAVNRTDHAHFSKMDSVIIPTDLSGDMNSYLSFPLKVPSLKEIHKIVFFSYATQTFAAYKNGELVITGPTNMGREKHLTPTGLFFTNWKAEVTTSTFNDEWELRWNFNVLNKQGVGWHQYGLPGYPASHSCLRLQEMDAKYLYNWADQWVLANKFDIRVKGTPVIIFGRYDFSSPKPWLQLIDHPQAMDITKNELKKIAQPYFNEIRANQKSREVFEIEEYLKIQKQSF
jgi:hypothetical protein